MEVRKYIYTIFGLLISRKMARKHRFFSVVRGCIGKWFLPEISIVRGKKMLLHNRGHSLELAFDGIYEALETHFLESLKLENKVTIDVGSCIGYYALLLSSNSGVVYAFEPEKINFQLLNENIGLNNLKNVFACNQAIGGKDGVGFLRVHESPGQHMVFYDRGNEGNFEKIDIITLDSFIKEKEGDFKNVGFVKIDAEGYEFEVLQGMTKIIQSSNQIIIQVEFAPQHLLEQNCDLSEMLLFIEKYGLYLHYWDFNTQRLLQLRSNNWLLHPGVIEAFMSGEKYSRNLLLAKERIDSSVPELTVLTEKSEIEILDANHVLENNEISLPRSGKYFVQFFRQLNFEGHSVLDIGTGYFGFLARHAKHFGASNVVAVDVNQPAIMSAKKQGYPSVDYRVSDVYSNIKDSEVFDIIISNPPQLPETKDSKVHDSAGKDGLLVIRRILSGFRKHSHKGSTLYLLVFDFIYAETFKLAQDNNLSCEIVAFYNRPVRQGGETEKLMALINKKYKQCFFETTNSGFIHKVFILEIKQI